MSVKKLINKSALHRDIASFFIENPSSLDTPRGISTWVKHDRARVEKALDELAAAGILIAHKTSSTTGYSLTGSKKITEEIKRALRSQQ